MCKDYAPSELRFKRGSDLNQAVHSTVDAGAAMFILNKGCCHMKILGVLLPQELGLCHAKARRYLLRKLLLLGVPSTP